MSPPRIASALAATIVAVLATAPAPARAERTLAWLSVESDARLDRAGDLHVRERQVIRFDGDWNGGERRFRVGKGQRLVFERLLQETAPGEVVELRRGDLSQVGRWNLVDGTTLRWRARAPADAPFARETRTYVLEYTIRSVLSRDADGAWRLWHDFAFPDRAWPILSARGSLEVDPAWQADRPGPLTVRSGFLPPGESLRLAAILRWVGPGPEPTGPLPPFGGLHALPLAALAAALALGVALTRRALVAHARARGQLARGPRFEEVDLAFLREHVLSHPPEVIGAAWDDRVGPPEVAATLARMEREGKLRSRVEDRRRVGSATSVLHLELAVPRSALQGYERDLVLGLFVDGDAIDTERLRAHYRSTGFDAADRIREEVTALVRELAPTAAGPRMEPSLAAALALLAAAALGAAVGPPDGGPGQLAAGIALVIVPFLATVGSAAALRRATGFRGALFLVLALLSAWAALALWIASGALGATLLAVAGHAAAPIAGMIGAVAIGRTARSAEEVLLRRRLAAARAWLIGELQRPAPRLEDAWTPYLVAFGLGPDMDAWFRAHGEAARRGAVVVSSGSRSGSGSGAGATWTGGGGSFSGGGASGTWAALGAIASGVPAAGASGGGGGGGRGGGSGGGGGGGW